MNITVSAIVLLLCFIGLLYVGAKKPYEKRKAEVVEEPEYQPLDIEAGDEFTLLNTEDGVPCKVLVTNVNYYRPPNERYFINIGGVEYVVPDRFFLENKFRERNF